MASLYPADTDSGEVTSYIPLKTVFAPPESCTSIFRQNGSSYVAYDPGYGLDINSNVICQPPAVTTWWNQADLGNAVSDHTVVSIGPLSCPSSWNTVATSVKDVSSTAAMCCPPGYYLADGEVLGACLSTVNSGYSGIFAYTDGPSVWSIMTTTVSAKRSTVGAIAVVGWNIRQTSGTSISTLSFTTSLSQTATPTSSSTTSPTSTSGSTSGLARGAAVGIWVGVGLGVIGLASLLAFFCLIRCRRRRRERDTREARTDDLSGVAVEAEPGQPFPSEVDNDGEIRALELHSEHRSATPVELCG
ncbi:hypothetical protein F5883DRAFT_463466 [Diaporthe sp. PMI_573]|nr:hypothetical protein F5883DRAFT_463466 [Diaporthaceae sp. PMI_573]